MAAIVITVTNIMFYATHHSTELSPFGREEPKVPGAVCPLILPNNLRRKDFFLVQFQQTLNESINYRQRTRPEATGRRPLPHSLKRDGDWLKASPTGVQ